MDEESWWDNSLLATEKERLRRPIFGLLISMRETIIGARMTLNIRRALGQTPVQICQSANGRTALGVGMPTSFRLGGDHQNTQNLVFLHYLHWELRTDLPNPLRLNVSVIAHHQRKALPPSVVCYNGHARISLPC
jgi:hypothetical protein